MNKLHLTSLIIPRNIFIFIVCLLLMSCTFQKRARDWQVMEGRILEEGTNRPIKDAIVVAQWRGTSYHEVCFHVETTTTNSEGQFVFPAWRNDTKWVHLGDPYVAIMAYKPGYRTGESNWRSRGPVRLHTTDIVILAHDKPERRLEGRYYLAPEVRPDNEILRYLLRFNGRASCDARDGSERNLISLLKILHAEAEVLAVRKEEKRRVELLLYDLEILELGFEIASKRHLQRR